MKVEGVKRVERVLRRLQVKVGDPNPSVVVGYRGVRYAIYVHEDMEAHHTVGKAHYLTDPAHTLAKSVSEQVGKDVLRGLTFGDALYRGGLRIQRQSQLSVPVDTGNLKGSAFTERELPGYPPKPEAELYQHGYGWEKPVDLGDWSWSNTFGRWSRLVTFADGWHGYTFPKI